MKEICIINYGSNAAVYGIGTYIKEYMNCLLNLGNKINLIELGIDNKQLEVKIKEKKGLRIFSIPYNRDKDIIVYNKSVCRLLRLYLKDSSDLIFHFHYFQSKSLFDSLKQYFPLSGYIFTIHYLYWSNMFNGDVLMYKNIIHSKNKKYIKNKYQDLISNYEKEKIFLKSVDKVVCLAEDTYSLLQDIYDINLDNLVLIPNGLTAKKIDISYINKENLRKTYCIQSDERIILFVGRVHKIKGIYPLLLAFEKIIQIYSKCRLIIIGDGDFVNVMQKMPNPVTQITFTGRLNKETLYKWYNIADIAVFPSYYEESSYVGIEMLMHGLPIVASDGYAVRNMFHNDNAVIAHIGDYRKSDNFVSELVSAILSLLKSDELLEEKHLQALNSYKTTFNLRYMQKKYAKLLMTFPIMR